MAIELSFALLAPLIVLMAVLYSSVGHGGASGYIAVMALFGLQADVMRPTALTMNILVTLWLLYRLNDQRRPALTQFWPLIALSAPAAFVGGMLPIENTLYFILLAVLLIASGCRMLAGDVANFVRSPAKPLHKGWLLLAGTVLGLLSGMTGVGGGIFLSPLILLCGWTSIRQSTAVAALFILVNSCFGLAGFFTQQLNVASNHIPDQTIFQTIFQTIAQVIADQIEFGWLIPLAFLGAIVGAELAKRRASPVILQRLLGLVLLIASAKIMHMGIN